MKNLPSKRASRDSLAREHTCQSRSIYRRELIVAHPAEQSGRFRTAITSRRMALAFKVRKRPRGWHLFRLMRICAASSPFFSGNIALTRRDRKSATRSSIPNFKTNQSGGTMQSRILTCITAVSVFAALATPVRSVAQAPRTNHQPPANTGGPNVSTMSSVRSL